MEGLTNQTPKNEIEKPRELIQLERVAQEIIQDALERNEDEKNLIKLAFLAIKVGGIITTDKKISFIAAVEECLRTKDLDPQIVSLLKTEHQKISGDISINKAA